MGIIGLVFVASAGAEYEVSPQNALESGRNKLPVVALLTPTEQIRQYVDNAAGQAGVNPLIAEWIIQHESQWNPGAVGDNGISLGLWQFNIQANPNISKDCALDYQCSTKMALQWILDGKINKWSSWRFRHIWYRDGID